MPTNATRFFSPLHRIFHIRIIDWNRERRLWMSHLNISFADRGMMPSSLFRDSESISISKSWLPSMVCVLPDPVCPYAMMHTLYLFSEHTISSIKCWKIHTASSACLNDNKHCWLHIEVKQKYIVLILAIHHAQDQYILALRATDEVVAALYWITERQKLKENYRKMQN